MILNPKTLQTLHPKTICFLMFDDRESSMLQFGQTTGSVRMISDLGKTHLSMYSVSHTIHYIMLRKYPMDIPCLDLPSSLHIFEEIHRYPVKKDRCPL